MRIRAALAALTAVAVSSPGMAAVDVRVSGQTVDVLATNAPLSEILDRLSRQTHMRVVYDGAPPRQVLSMDLRGRTPVEAVVAALEGQGVNYALSMDPTGSRVETLLVSGSAPSSPRAGAAAAESRRQVVHEVPPEVAMDEPEAAAEDEGQPPPDTSAGLNLAAPGTKEVQPEEAPPPDLGVGFSASPFAPKAQPPQPPQPHATPPPFNP